MWTPRSKAAALLQSLRERFLATQRTLGAPGQLALALLRYVLYGRCFRPPVVEGRAVRSLKYLSVTPS